jgi:hypothetical protein
MRKGDNMLTEYKITIDQEKQSPEKIKEILKKLPYEILVSALFEKGEDDGYECITDKTKWREPMMADRLGHIAHKKISAGKNSDKYGSDALDPKNEIFAEYKSGLVKESSLKNLFEHTKDKKGNTYAPYKIKGIYNGAYKQSAIDAYSKIDHYFGLFYKEIPILIIKVDTDYVIDNLQKGFEKMDPNKTKNLNGVEVNLNDTHLYEVAYKNEEWWEINK